MDDAVAVFDDGLSLLDERRAGKEAALVHAVRDVLKEERWGTSVCGGW